mgnify:CR=1 FL=1
MPIPKIVIGKLRFLNSFKIRHTATVEGKIASAREALGMSVAYFDDFSKQANELFEREVSDKKFSEIINALYPKPEADKKGSLKKWENKVGLINDIYTGEFNGMISGTAWGAFNALTERLDWYRSARGENSESMYAAASGFDVAVTAEKNRLLKVVKDLIAA